jgi:hypothetical protein
VSHSREQIAFAPSPAVAQSLNEAIQEESSQSVLFLDTTPTHSGIVAYVVTRKSVR